MSKISRRKALSLLGASSALLALKPTVVLGRTKTISCVWSKTFAPYSMERNGHMTGILVECMDEILANRMGFKVDHKGFDWLEAQELVMEGEADCLCTNPTDARKQYMVFNEEPVVESLPTIFCAMDNPRREAIDNIRTIEGLKGFRQVDYKGNGWAHETFPPDHPITYMQDMDKVMLAIAQGKADFFIGNSLAAMYAIKKMGLKNKIVGRQVPFGKSSSFHFGVRKTPHAQELVENYQVALDEAQLDGAIRKIVMNYL